MSVDRQIQIIIKTFPELTVDQMELITICMQITHTDGYLEAMEVFK